MRKAERQKLAMDFIYARNPSFWQKQNNFLQKHLKMDSKEKVFTGFWLLHHYPVTNVQNAREK